MGGLSLEERLNSGASMDAWDAPAPTPMFCLGEKQGMMLNNECSSWYNRLGDFSINLGKKKTLIVHQQISMYGPTKQLTPAEYVVNGTECYDNWVCAIY